MAALGQISIVPKSMLPFVHDGPIEALASRIAHFPPDGLVTIRERMNALTLPTVEKLHRDGVLFLQRLRSTYSQRRIQNALKLGCQQREAEQTWLRH